MAAREMGGLSLADALALCELLAACDPKRYERAALRWLQRFIDERLPSLTEVAGDGAKRNHRKERTAAPVRGHSELCGLARCRCEHPPASLTL